MRIGLLGAGRIATALAAQLIKAGHEVMLSNSGDRHILAERSAALGAGAGTPSEAAAFGDVVVIAVRWDDVPTVLTEVGDLLDGKIVLDVTNPLGEIDGRLQLLPFDAPTAAERTAQLVPGARVVKAFNHYLAEVLAQDPVTSNGRRVALIAGDDHAAKLAVAELADSAGFDPIDTGSLAAGGALFEAGGPINQTPLLSLRHA